MDHEIWEFSLKISCCTNSEQSEKLHLPSHHTGVFPPLNVCSELQGQVDITMTQSKQAGALARALKVSGSSWWALFTTRASTDHQLNTDKDGR